MWVEKMIETPFGSTYLKQIGTGPLVFVIHGGPGFDHRYLVSGLAALAQKRTLVFYDQPGCGRSAATPSLSPFEVFSHFRWLSHHLSKGEPVEVIAHSWGSLVLVGALLDKRLSSSSVANFQNGLLINPVPISTTKYAFCGQNFLTRIGLIERLKLNGRIFFEQDGAKIMDSLLPYYVLDKTSLPSGNFWLNKTTYLQMNKQLKNFDYTSEVGRLPKLSAIIGSEDFTTVDMIDELALHLSAMHIMENTVHFPFWEQPNMFMDILHATFI